MSERIIVVGGGAIGLSIAWELTCRGHHVHLVECEQEVGRGTSWAAAGILPPANAATAIDPIDQLRGLSHQLFPDWVTRLQEVAEIDSGFIRCGGLYLADSPGERASLIGLGDYWRELEIACEPLTGAELAAREPQLQITPDRCAWWVPEEWQVHPPSYLSALAVAVRAMGGIISEGIDVTDLRETSSTAAVQVASEWWEADRLVVCGGAWTGKLAPSLHLESSLVPIRGQMLLLKSSRPLLTAIANLGHRYVVCRRDGHTLVGSCEEEVGFSLGTTAAVLTSLREFAVDLVPGLCEARQVDAWSGLRPMTFDGFPMIGRLPGSDRVFVAAGHFRSGIHLSPATAVVLADEIEGRQPVVDLDPFRVGKQQSRSTEQANAAYDP